ncbi:MAG: 5-methyltetrahydropteroyltriglutamate--homocysteine S-methyltransferase [Rhodospirillaceae bacterium]
MTDTTTFFHADHVGSLLRPQRLHEARADWHAGKIDRAALTAVEDECIAECVRMQESVGLEAVTDGEFRRENWWIHLIGGMDGIEITEPATGDAFQKNPDYGGGYVPKGVKVVGRLGGGGTISIGDFGFLKRTTGKTAKMTLPSPTRMVYYGGRDAVDRDTYPTMEDFWSDVATLYQQEIAALEAAGCRYIQIDDPILTYFLDERIRDEMKAAGQDPDTELAIYGDAINACISKRSPDTYLSLHLCRGNAASQWNAEGSYDRMAELLFPRMNVDAWFLEYDDARSGGFEPLRHMPDGRKVVLGLVTTKTGRMEDAEELRARVAEAAKIVPMERLGISPQCGFASIEAGNKIAADDQWAKLKFVTGLARELWV